MSKNIAIVLIILLLLVSGFAFWNYDRLNKIQDSLTEKHELLEESKELIQKQEVSISELEEQMKQSEQKVQSLAELDLMEQSEKLFSEQITQYQQELDELRTKLEETIEQSKTDYQDIVLLKQQKDKLEDMLAEKEVQWQSREEESKGKIIALNEEIKKYESNMNVINENISELRQYLDSEIETRRNLEQEIAQYQDRISSLQEQLTISQEDETQVQLITQLQSSKEILEEKIEEKDVVLEEIQGEQTKLQKQLEDYEIRITALQENIDTYKKNQKIFDDFQVNLVQLREEKDRLETMLAENEEQWQARDEESVEKITSLKEEIQRYEANLKEIGSEMLSLREGLSDEVSLKRELQDRIELLTEEIDYLKDEMADYRETEQSYLSVLNQLHTEKEELREKVDNDIEIDEREYQELMSQISIYQDQIKEFKEELAVIKDRDDRDKITSSEQVRQIQEEIVELERMLSEKEEEWKNQNKENKELIAYLKNQLKEYQEEIELVKIDSSLFKEEVSAQVELQQERIARIRDREEQIAELTSEIEKHAIKIEEYEAMIEQLRVKLQEQQDLSYQEKQKLVGDLTVLLSERDLMQNNFEQYRTIIAQLESEVAELYSKLARLEEDKVQQYYEVKKGDCLWNIAKSSYNDGIAWTKIFKANQELIENPDLIYPYQQIIIPD
jgi:chromosome segregation ATPase